MSDTYELPSGQSVVSVHGGFQIQGTDASLSIEDAAALGEIARRFMPNTSLPSMTTTGVKEGSYHHRFHRLWTAAVGKPSYDKGPWRVLDVRFYGASSVEEVDVVLAEAKALSEAQQEEPRG
jgi:hypothetical protein